MVGLVLADRDEFPLVEDDVGGLEHRVAQESVGVQLLFGQLLLLFLERRDALEPGQGRDHGQQEMELGMLLDGGLDEEDALVRIEPQAEKVAGHVERVAADGLRVRVFGTQGVPVHDRIETAVFVLEPDPVAEGAGVVSEMGRPRGPDPAEDGFLMRFAHVRKISG